MDWTYDHVQEVTSEMKTLKEENSFQATVIEDLNTNLSRIWAEFETKNKQLNSILEEQQAVRRDLRNIQYQQEILEKEVDFLYKKEEKEDNFFPQTTQDDKPITKVKEEESENQAPESQDPKLRSESIYQDGENLSYSEKQALKQLPDVVNWPKFSGIGEYDHMELIDYINGLFVDVPKIPDYWITTRLNTAFRGHANIWYTEMKEIHGRKSWPWWRNQIIQKYSNGTWIWQKTISFESDRYSTEKDPYEWCLKQTKRLKSIDPNMTIEMRNHKILTKLPGDLEHAVKCRCSKISSIDDIANVIQDVRKKTSIGSSSPYRSHDSREKPKILMEKDLKPTNGEEAPRRRNTCHNCGSPDHYANNCPKGKKKIFAIEEESVEEHMEYKSDSDSMGNGLRQDSDSGSEPIEQYLLEYEDEKTESVLGNSLKPELIQPKNGEDRSGRTIDAKEYLEVPKTGMAFIHGAKSKLDVYIENKKHPLIFDTGANCSVVAKEYLDRHFPMWNAEILLTKARSFKSAAGKMKSLGIIQKIIIIPHKMGNLRLHIEFVVLENAKFDGFLMGTEYHRIYGISIHNYLESYLIIGQDKQRKFYFETDNPNQIKRYSNRDYLTERRNKPPEKDQWVKLDDVSDKDSFLKGSRASIRTKESHQ